MSCPACVNTPGYASPDQYRILIEILPTDVVADVARRQRELESGGNAQISLGWNMHKGKARDFKFDGDKVYQQEPRTPS